MKPKPTPTSRKRGTGKRNAIVPNNPPHPIDLIHAKPRQRKVSKVRARKMWDSNGVVVPNNMKWWCEDPHPVWLLDLSTPEKFDAAVEVGAKALHARMQNEIRNPFKTYLWRNVTEKHKGYYRRLAVAVMESQGFTRPAPSSLTKKEV